MPTQFREIRPKHSEGPPQVHQPAPPRPRGPSTTVACIRCRTRKIKCDGQRPACQACCKANAQCVFDAHPGESRTQMLRRENQELKTRLAHVEWLLSALCEGPKNTRAWIREAICAGARPDHVFQQAQMAPQLDPERQATRSPRNVYAAARVPEGVELEDFSVSSNGWMGLDTNTDASLYSSSLSLMEDVFPWSQNDLFQQGAP